MPTDSDITQLQTDLAAERAASAKAVSDAQAETQAVQAKLDAANAQHDSDLKALDVQQKQIAADAVQIKQLTADKSALIVQGKLDAATITQQAGQILALQPKPSATTIHEAGGKPITYTMATGETLSGDVFKGAVFGKPQCYALQTNATGAGTLNGVSATSDSGGIQAQGTGTVLDGTITDGNGQNGLAGHAAVNLTVKNAKSRGNNTKGYDPNNEAGNKFSKCTNVLIEDSEFSGNWGINLWGDVNCKKFVVTRCVLKNSIAPSTFPNAQVALFQWEISSDLDFNNNTLVCGPGQNTAFMVRCADTVKFYKNDVTGQFGITSDNRAATNPIHDISITGNIFRGNLYFPGGIPNLVIENNEFHLKPGQPVAYIDEVGVDLAGLRKAGYDKTQTCRVVAA